MQSVQSDTWQWRYRQLESHHCPKPEPVRRLARLMLVVCVRDSNMKPREEVWPPQDSIWGSSGMGTLSLMRKTEATLAAMPGTENEGLITGCVTHAVQPNCAGSCTGYARRTLPASEELEKCKGDLRSSPIPAKHSRCKSSLTSLLKQTGR